eukprot:COSAG06_NODE_23191_length_700_cov_0.763727_1_plen_83_part_10
MTYAAAAGGEAVAAPAWPHRGRLVAAAVTAPASLRALLGWRGRQSGQAFFAAPGGDACPPRTLGRLRPRAAEGVSFLRRLTKR